MNQQKSKWKTWHKVVLGVLAAFFLLMAIALNSEKEVKPKEVQPNDIELQKNDVKDEIVFDLSKLIDKKPTDIIKFWGAPDEKFEPTEIQKSEDIPTTFTYNKKWVSVDIDFDTRKNIPASFFISDTTGVVTDYNSLLKAANISGNETNLLIKPVQALGQKGKYTGVTITVKK
jgi:hypothetical protein